MMETLNLIDMDTDQVGSLIEQEQGSSRWPWSQQALRYSLEADHDCLLIAVDGATAGYCVLMDNTEAIEVLNIVVFPAWRRRGVARGVIEAVCARAGTAGRGAVWLEVREDNCAAIALYLSCGFCEQGRRPDYYADATGNSIVAAILMEKNITER